MTNRCQHSNPFHFNTYEDFLLTKSFRLHTYENTPPQVF
jgi:hypothetical protein